MEWELVKCPSMFWDQQVISKWKEDKLYGFWNRWNKWQCTTSCWWDRSFIFLVLLQNLGKSMHNKYWSKLQKRAIRAITKVGFYEFINILLKKSNTLKFGDISHVRRLAILLCALKGSLSLRWQLFFKRRK